MKLSFWHDTTARGGGSKTFFRLAEELAGMGHEVGFLSTAAFPSWYPLKVDFHQLEDDLIPQGESQQVVISHLTQIPRVWRRNPSARLLLLCLGYEGYSRAQHRGQVYQDVPVLHDLLNLGVEAAAYSSSVQRALVERGCVCHLFSWALEAELFPLQPQAKPAETARIAMIVDPAIPFKGFNDALEALAGLKRPVELHLLTRNLSWQPDGLEFPVVVHRTPERRDIAKILASCHLLLCSSWYEGLGRPALEAMAVGVPVVSTAHEGAENYARDGINMLLAEVGDTAGLTSQMERVLSEPGLAQDLRQAGVASLEGHRSWTDSARGLVRVLERAEWCPRPEGVDWEQYLKRLKQAGLLFDQNERREHHRVYQRIKRLANQEHSYQRSSELRVLEENLREKAQSGDTTSLAQRDACRILLNFPESRSFLNL